MTLLINILVWYKKA